VARRGGGGRARVARRAAGGSARPRRVDGGGESGGIEVEAVSGRCLCVRKVSCLETFLLCIAS